MPSMAPSQPRDIDAHSSTFNQVNGDQTNANVVLTINHHPSDLSRVTTHVTPHATIRPDSYALLVINIQIIGDILQNIESRQDSSENYRDLIHDLRSLCEALESTRTALQGYRNTPLYSVIADAINLQLDQCFTLLTTLHHCIRTYRQSLIWTIISRLWRRVWWSSWTESDLQNVRANLGACHLYLDALLKSVNSVPWTEIGNEMLTDETSKKQVLVPARNHPPLLQHDLANSVLVIDHLGVTIPIPTRFCTSWEAFDRIIRAYCKDRMGSEFIERGDYHLLYDDGCQVVDRSALGRTVKPGMLLEISIIMRKKKPRVGGKETCPRCGFQNSIGDFVCDWLQCYQCSGRFQVQGASGCAERPKSTSQNDTFQASDDAPFFRRISLYC